VNTSPEGPMAAQALYLKYRPQTFDEAVGQEPVIRTLRNALRTGRISHAYLFAGPRGTGKTTLARLVAKAVNCLAPESERPCNRCEICIAIAEGRLLDLIEIDAASNRGIDEIRDIREKVSFRPNQARYKVYVLDEAHMLTDAAFNALLKTLEEPPPHVIFALVTTDPHKLPATILSRCQRYDFRRIPLQAMIGRLEYIAGQEGLRVDQAALELIARQATGAMRDAISLLDQLTAYGEDTLTLEMVQDLLGAVTSEAALGLVQRLAHGDPAAALEQVNRVLSEGADPRQYAHEVIEVLRGLLLIQTGAGTRLLNATAEQAADLQALAQRVDTAWVMSAIQRVNEAAQELRTGLQTLPQLPLELACVELTLAALPKRVQVPERVHETTPRPASSAPRPELAPTTVREAASQPVLASQTEGGTQAPQTEGGTQAPQTEGGTQAPQTEGGTQAPQTEGGAQASQIEGGAQASQIEGGDEAVQESPARVERASPPAPVESALSSSSEDELSVGQIEAAWIDLLAAVRTRNPATQGLLNSGCKPVEVTGNRVTITFPYKFLTAKLDEAQRQVEVTDAFSEVLGMPCAVRFVLENEFQPSPPSDASSLNDRQVAEIRRWAEERGGETRVIGN
jgi:DNA polymerase-3 subunit gamma/tau